MGCGSSLASSPIRAVDGPRKPGSSSIWPKRWAHLAGDRKEIPPQDVALSYDEVPLRGNTTDDSEWNGESFDMPDVEAPEDNLEVLEDEGVKRTISSLSFGKMFVDQYFPPQDSSIYFNRRPVEGNIVWMRPHELVEKPELLVNGVSRHDIVQGILGDCWFLSSCAAVAQRPDLMGRVIPSNQKLHGEGYKGAARFRLWRFGRWVTIYVDDLLPTRNGELIYSRSSEKREFWVALLEKAYAKLHGSYEALEGGQAMDALVDLTSGLAERYDLEEVPPHLFLFLLQASSHGAFITCSRKGDWRMATTADPNGLVSGHAYTVTGVANVSQGLLSTRDWTLTALRSSKVTLNSGDEINLVRVRNPWGNCIEWTGPWNDNDPVWNQVDSRTKRQLDWKQRGDGEFWMCFDDFRKEFEEVSICTLGPDFNGDGIAEQAGQVKAIRGHWISDRSCGGSRNNVELFATNPQYLLTIYSFGRCSSIGPIKAAMDRKCCIVISLMQVHRNAPRHLGVKMMQIGFVIYKTDNSNNRLSKQCFYNNFDEGNSGPYINYREVFGRYEFYPGNYVIVPATFEPGYPGEFMIRVYSETAIDLRELK